MIFLAFAALLGFLLGCVSMVIIGALLFRRDLKENYENEYLSHVLLRNIALSQGVQELEERVSNEETK